MNKFVCHRHMLAGRIPVAEGLNFEKGGVKRDQETGILVDDYLYTTNRRIRAIGDAAVPYQRV